MTYTAIRDQLQTYLEAVPNIGTVLSWPKPSIDPDIFGENYLSISEDGTPEFRAWAIARRRTFVSWDSENDGAALGSKYALKNEISLFGIMGVDTSRSTYDAFNNLIDAVIAAITPHISLGGTVTVVQTPWNVTTLDQRDLGGRIVHFCELRATTLELSDAVDFD